MRTLLAVIALMPLLAFVGSAKAEEGKSELASSHFQRGQEAFDKGDYQVAIIEFGIANRLAPAPLLLFNLGLCHDELGQNTEAIEKYEAFLATGGNEEISREVRARIEELKETLIVASDLPTPLEERNPNMERAAVLDLSKLVPHEPVQNQQPEPIPQQSESRPIYKNWWFWAIVGVGTIVIVDVAISRGKSNNDRNSIPQNLDAPLMIRF